MFKLRYTEVVEAVWNALPDEAREELGLALLDVCDDPWKTTSVRRGDSEDVERVLELRYTTATLLVMNAPPVRRVYLRHIDHID